MTSEQELREALMFACSLAAESQRAGARQALEAAITELVARRTVGEMLRVRHGCPDGRVCAVCSSWDALERKP